KPRNRPLPERGFTNDREEALAQARVICEATDLPVSADLEKGFGDAPEVVAETIRLAAETGLVGCSIEDASGNPDAPIFELSHATERVAAAAAAARALPFPFTLTGRTENFLRGRPDLGDTITRLKAYEAAGRNPNSSAGPGGVGFTMWLAPWRRESRSVGRFGLSPRSSVCLRPHTGTAA